MRITRQIHCLVLGLTASLALHPFAAAKGAETLRLATTTSTYETGLLDHILPPFERKHHVTVHVISVGTGKAIKTAENGDVDVILVHARAAEDKFVADGYGVDRHDVMYNDFILVGPAADPAGITGMKDAAKALLKIATGKHLFISRGDNSGTHAKERQLWEKAGFTPAGKWYSEAGQGMSATLRMADEKDAYTIVDRATFVANAAELRIGLLVEGDKALFNPYGVIPVNPDRHKHVNYRMSTALVQWLISPACQKMIGAYRKNGQQLFHPNAVDPIK